MHRSVSVLLLAFSSAAGATTINVPADHATIQAALSAASSGDTILVAPGTYFERGLSFQGKDLVLRSASGPEVTIIDGSDTAPVFELDAGLSRAAVIEGFTVRRGSSSSASGAGIDVFGGSPVLRDNVISDNASTGNGAGVKVRGNGNPLIEGNRFESNSAGGKGGGLQVKQSSAEIRNNVFEGNTATGTATSSGGGLNLSACTGTPIVSGNAFLSNSSTFSGGGLSVLSSNVVLDDNLLEGNSSEFGGGAHLETHGATVSWTITDNRILDNTATRNGGGLNLFGADEEVTAEVTGNRILGNECINPACLAGTESECGQGGGLRASQGTGEETYDGNVIAGNRADKFGAALLLGLQAQGKIVTFSHNLVKGNRALFDVPAVGSKGLAEIGVRANRFLENAPDGSSSSRPFPGGLEIREIVQATVENNYFGRNQGRLAGALLAASGGPPMTALIRNNTFSDNVTSNNADGSLRISVDGTVVNNLFVGDRRGLSVRDSPSIAIENNDFFGFSDGVYKDETRKLASVASLNAESFASANVELAPSFVNSDYVYLSGGSALNGAGSCVDAPGVDIDGDSRPLGPGCEIGADEHNPSTLAIFTDGFESGNTSTWTH